MNTITEAEIVKTLTPLNGLHFSVPSLPEYARKVLSLGRSITVRSGGDLLAYVLYYDNSPTAFVTMIWTSPIARGSGLATALVRQVLSQTGKVVVLDVHADNPAKRIYDRLGFRECGRDGHTIRMSTLPASP